MTELSVIIPVFNDREVLPELYRRLIPVLNGLSSNFEIVFIDDGSKDESVEILKDLQNNDYRIKIVILANNFGQSNAIAAGLENCSGDVIVVMDCDLEDRPEDIPKLIEVIEKNDEQMAIAQREIRKDSHWNKLLSKLFFQVAAGLTEIEHPENLGVFRAFKRSVYQHIKQDKELHGTILSRFYLAKIPFATVKLVKEKRFAGRSGYTFRKRCKLALDRLLPHLKNKRLRQLRDPYFVIKEIIEIRETK
ncbi:MAG: glycosyltransferase family 2 protein [Candidatus Cloacimonadales bacterium]|nr:glycosyltransferase family 2 protein [Candidatus Cloacimonadales bacterium]